MGVGVGRGADGVGVATVARGEGVLVLFSVLFLFLVLFPVLVLWLFGQAAVEPVEEGLHGTRTRWEMEENVCGECESTACCSARRGH